MDLRGVGSPPEVWEESEGPHGSPGEVRRTPWRSGRGRDAPWEVWEGSRAPQRAWKGQELPQRSGRGWEAPQRSWWGREAPGGLSRVGSPPKYQGGVGRPTSEVLEG